MTVKYTSHHVEVRQDGAVLHVLLTRPEKLNALTADMLDAIGSMLDDVVAERIRVVVFRGAGRSFCAGADMASWQAIESPEEAAHWIRRGHDVFNKIATSPAVTIAAIHGYVLGGGFELALAADIRIAAENTVIGLPEISVGAVPGWGGVDRVRRLAGDASARRLVLEAKPVAATELVATGLVSHLVPDDELELFTEELVAQVSGHPAGALTAGKILLGSGIIDSVAIERDVALAQRVFGTLRDDAGSTSGSEEVQTREDRP